MIPFLLLFIVYSLAIPPADMVYNKINHALKTGYTEEGDVNGETSVLRWSKEFPETILKTMINRQFKDHILESCLVGEMCRSKTKRQQHYSYLEYMKYADCIRQFNEYDKKKLQHTDLPEMNSACEEIIKDMSLLLDDYHEITIKL